MKQQNARDTNEVDKQENQLGQAGADHTAIKRAVIFANGDMLDAAYARQQLQEDDYIILANGGTRLAHPMGIVPHLLVGDSDSLPNPMQAWLLEHKVVRIHHPRDKDQTDLELAIYHAIDAGATHLLLLGLSGGRVDHMLANFSLLAAVCRAGVQAEAVTGRQHIYGVCEGACATLRLQGEVGQTLSLLPWGGDVVGVQTEGLKWELHNETLHFGAARGISNVLHQPAIRISVEGGMLLVFHHRGLVE